MKFRYLKPQISKRY